ncbi:hypothetical protein SUGI_0528990 [Cryptomeria japonica]|uniref:bifunctional dethiobiotin synthetase/7,8-diamino-pelargonic acid aminotransferase, mitochondrial isoform X2 n=1 Tax=Cryptomeria japonica TaxID=3369 RepID=UPI002408D075|nr:bifunctional dethiobiotin synthetase/7,8-diamino-pelargonic acid aminotransferase, mitochondrial isoform X2 [Cryptomeria japonica]GLJ26997.1 hypothetical protein SUGI_0528990 [Cryptomeria japonica]
MTALALVRRRFKPPLRVSLHEYRRTFSSLGEAEEENSPKQKLHIPCDFEVDMSHPSYIIWGSNTSVGKTLVSTGLATSLLNSSQNLVYIKPVQTGFPQDSDSRYVYRKVTEIFRQRKPLNNIYASYYVDKTSPRAWELLPGSKGRSAEASSYHGLQGMKNVGAYEGQALEGSKKRLEALNLVCKTIYGWHEAVSPHLAASGERCVVEDCEILENLQNCLRQFSFDENNENRWSIIETAGGVASPGPSGTLQCDLYRPFRLPSILVGDGRLGGISGTISAYETLCIRGYDIDAVILADAGLSNEMYLSTYLHHRVPVFLLPKIPEDPNNTLLEWFSESHKIFSEVKDTLETSYVKRMNRLHEMPTKAKQLLWWPFTQHSLVREQYINLIDSRFGENFGVYKGKSHKDVNRESIVQQFDACASWWTQGPNAILQSELAKEVGYTIGRFGHVMYPENVYEPALRCAELLLEGVGKGWASRVYFSDNGSTAIEIALKMAFRKFAFDHGFISELYNGDLGKICPEFKVLALRGSYHGDTLGAMEAQAPSAYTGFFQQPWYSGRGLFLDPPSVFLHNKEWQLQVPDALMFLELKCPGLGTTCEALFSTKRDESTLAMLYCDYISQHLSRFSTLSPSKHVAALIIEPVIHAAGGMHMIDPLFQRVLVKECRKHRIPVIFDEVFTGFWRLGAQSAAELLGCVPDIACFAKLMTGGIVPLAATLATESIFGAFEGKSKLFALLHGHSYSGHAVGCAAAVKAIHWFRDAEMNQNICSNGSRLVELWDSKLVAELSAHSSVKRVIALGTLCALELQADESNTGYGSLSATSLVQKLRDDGVYLRPLGNVIYLMCGPATPPTVCSRLLQKLHKRLDEY